jgi:hypothetical protein
VGVERPQGHCGRLKQRVCYHYHRVFQSLWVAVRYNTVLHADSLALSLYLRVMFMMTTGSVGSVCEEVPNDCKSRMRIPTQDLA